MLQGFSWTTFDELSLFVLSLIKPTRILDIGSGEGKYGRLIRSKPEFSSIHLTSIEYEAAREQELLDIGYDEVRSMSALDIFNQPDETFEVVILGDVIEHFKKSEGMDLLQYLNYRSEYIIIVTPEAMPQNMPNFYEGHNSVWRLHDMKWHDYFLHMRCGELHFFILRGYLNNHSVSLAHIQATVAEEQLVVRRGDTRCVGISTGYFYAQLELHDTQPVDKAAGDDETLIIYRPN